MDDPFNNLPSTEETLSHPAFSGVIWNLEPERTGLTPVGASRGGPYDIKWSVHGIGPSKILFVMGVGGNCASWQNQILYFGHTNRDKYSVLVLDNRGSGSSSKALWPRFTTSGLALDCIEVLDHVGWTGRKDVHVVGISLGGMIAQEIAYADPERWKSLSLFCTSAQVTHNKTFMENATQRLGLLKPKTVHQAVVGTARQIFNEDWLLRPDEIVLPDVANTPKCKAPAKVQTSGTDQAAEDAPAADQNQEGFTYQHFDNNFQRFLAVELAKRQHPDGWYSKSGMIAQMLAGGGHKKSPEQLKQIADAMGRENIMVVHGTGDQMIDFQNGQVLMDMLQPGEVVKVEGMSHTPCLDRPQWCNEILEERLVKWDAVER